MKSIDQFSPGENRVLGHLFIFSSFHSNEFLYMKEDVWELIEVKCEMNGQVRKRVKVIIREDRIQMRVERRVEEALSRRNDNAHFVPKIEYGYCIVLHVLNTLAY